METDTTLYDIQVTGRQAHLMYQALDFFARIGAGQLEELLNHPGTATLVTGDTPAQARQLVADLKYELLGLSPTAGISIHAETLPDAVKIVWDIGHVIRHRLAWDRVGNPETRDLTTMAAVDYDTPVAVGSQPLPHMQVHEPPVSLAALVERMPLPSRDRTSAPRTTKQFLLSDATNHADSFINGWNFDTAQHAAAREQLAQILVDAFAAGRDGASHAAIGKAWAFVGQYGRYAAITEITRLIATYWSDGVAEAVTAYDLPTLVQAAQDPDHLAPTS